MKEMDAIPWYAFLLARPRRSCRRLSIGCLLILLLFLGCLCGLLSLLFNPRQAAAAHERQASQPLAVWLLIDNSNSMFEKDGVGSDPDRLRLDAARLFLSYLGVDEQDLTHQAGVIFFGTGAETAVPLTPLTDDQKRADLFAQIADPPRMGWTDHLTALQLAKQEIEASEEQSRPVIILLTDGKPEWPDTFSIDQQVAYRAALREQSDWLAAQGIPLFIILLANTSAELDTDIDTIWQPLWQAMSLAAPPGHFYGARTARDLPYIYHEIVVALTGEETAGVVLETAVLDAGSDATVHIPANLAQVTLVISKSNPDQQVSIQTETGEALTAVSPKIRRAGSSDNRAEEVWVFEEPPAGIWQVHITGPGEITIWQDYKQQPPATVIVTTVAATIPATSLPTTNPTPSPSPVATATEETAVVAFITPSAPIQLTEPTTASPPRATWTWWFLGSLLVAVVAALGSLWWHSTRQPRVSGSLQITGDGQVPRLIDLDSLGKTAVSLGKLPADIPLPGATATATLVPGARLEDSRLMFIRSEGGYAEGGITLDGRPAPPSTPLTDAMLIDLGGGVQVRYENLRLRRAGRLSTQSLSR